MEWDGAPTPFDPVRPAYIHIPLRWKSNTPKLRERLFDFFGVFTEENRKPKMKDRPVPQPASKP